MKKLVTFIVLSATATGVVEFGGWGVFEANRIYERRYEAIRIARLRANQPNDPETVHYLVTEAHGPGLGVMSGLWHGLFGMPRVLISFAATMLNRTTGTRLYTSHDPVFAKHNAGKPYIVGFVIGILAFVAAFAAAMPKAPRAAEDDDASLNA